MRNLERTIVTAVLLLSGSRPGVLAHPDPLNGSNEPNISIPTQVPKNTPIPFPTPTETPVPFISLEEAIRRFKDGTTDVKAIYSKDSFLFGVVQQPPGLDSFVSPYDQILTQFMMPDKMVAFLAHNQSKAGDAISNIRYGEEIYQINGDGKTEKYTITGRILARAIIPLSPYSPFVLIDENLNDISGTFSAKELYEKIYRNSEIDIVFLTCIENERDINWGRLFVIGRKMK
jgi:hypothetical protein